MPRSSRAPVSLQAVKSIAQVVPAVADRLVYSIRMADIEPSDRNPRHHLDGLDDLADSLRAHGLLQPIVVRRRQGGYVLIAGHRRFEAARKLAWTEIAAVVRDETDDQDAYILTLVENLQREDLTPKEEAAALEVLVRERGWSTRQVGQAIKRDPMYVSRRLRVFDDTTLAPLVLANKLPVSTAEELLLVKDLQQREAMAQQVVDEGWERPQVRAAVRECSAALHLSMSAKQRSRRAIKLAAELREVLEAGPIAELSAEARTALGVALSSLYNEAQAASRRRRPKRPYELERACWR